MMTARRTAAGATGVAAAALLTRLARRYRTAVDDAERSWNTLVAVPLRDLGEVDAVTILPIVERLTAAPGLVGEPGVSYLITAGGTRILFDSGLSGGRRQSALTQNATALKADLGTLDAIVISHLHPDHVGGVKAVRNRTFSLSREAAVPDAVPAFVPTSMTHDHAEMITCVGPRVIAPGVALLPPLPRALFWMGPVAEQALIVNVRGFGLVLVTGCGHPPIERMLGVAERVLDVPIAAVVGGLHLPVHALGTPFMLQATIGSPNWPWRPMGENDVRHVMDEIEARGPRLVALSGHDSSPWTWTAFAERFGERYGVLRVGDAVQVDRFGARFSAPRAEPV